MATRDTYTKQEWADLPEKTTPITAESLSHIEEGIESAMDNRSLKELYDDTCINVGRAKSSTKGIYSTAEGSATTASGMYSHSEGNEAKATGAYAHAEGYRTTAGTSTVNALSAPHAEGYVTTASGNYSHAEGRVTTASGTSSHAEGYETTSAGDYSHAEGNTAKVFGSSGHAEGINTIAGYESYVNASNAPHAEGGNTLAAGHYAHAEGYGTTAGSNPSVYAPHAEGNNTVASGYVSHAEGNNTVAKGQCAHAEGDATTASGSYSHSEGYGTVASDAAQHAGGKYNVETSGAVVIGGGKPDTTDSFGNTVSNRKNIFTLDWEGNAVFAGDVTNGNGVSMNSLKSAVDEAKEIAEGASIAKTFDTKADLDEWLAVEGNSDTLSVGQNIYIVETDTPDYWWDGTGLQALETGKITIEELGYDETMAILNAESEVA